jgi:membrane protease YdiL (CAAX protease family)
MNQKPRPSLNPAVEILIVVFCVLVAEWLILPIFGKNYFAVAAVVPVSAAFVFMFFSHRARRESLRDLGWRADNFLKSLMLLAPPMLAATVFLILVGWWCESLRMFEIRLSWSLFGIFLGMFVWGLIQQYPLQGFINRRAQLIWGSENRLVTLLTASIFALLHLPNLWLTAATFCGGLLWSWAYQKTPNLFALALSHSLMTVVLVTTFPYSSLYGMRVGYGYFL